MNHCEIQHVKSDLHIISVLKLFAKMWYCCITREEDLHLNSTIFTLYAGPYYLGRCIFILPKTLLFCFTSLILITNPHP